MPTRFVSVYVLVALFASMPLSVSASAWALLSQPTSLTLYHIDVQDDVVMAVGVSGTIVVSLDAGATWKSKSSGTSSDLYDVVTLSETKAIAVGSSGVILQTSDAGSTWTRATTTGLSAAEQSYGLFSVTFPSSSVGYAVGTHALVLKTTNGGSTWTKVASPIVGGTATLNNIVATSTKKLWVVGENGTIATSANGGTSWTIQSSGTTSDLLRVKFFDSTRGWVAGADRTLLKTTNGGSSWSAIPVEELESGEDIYDISFTSTTSGILSGFSGALLETDDGGSTWERLSTNGFPVLRDLYQVSADERWGVGVGGVVYRFDDSAPSKPANFDVEGDNDAVTDATPTFGWSPAIDAESSVDYYKFKVDSGAYSNVGDTTSTTHDTTLTNGTHLASLYAVDRAGNVSATATLSFTVDVNATSSSALTVSRITPTTAVRGETVTFSTRLTSEGAIESCNLYVDDGRARGMTVKTDVAYTTLSFDKSGTHTLYARCVDDAGRSTSGKSATVSVRAGSTHVDPGEIVKIACEGDVLPNDSCTAVYYYGVDGKRHAFPNESIFASWYADFDDLVILSASAMAELPLGRNVTYRPGARLVKFSTKTVYAVSYGGLLRPIANAQIAEVIFGDDWASTIHTVEDVFFGNYRIGSTIESSVDFTPSTAQSSARTIDATF